METPTMKEAFSDFMKKITRPKLLSTLQPISINIIRGETENIIEIYPFFTINDLKIAIYELYERQGYAAPNNQLIFIDKKGRGVEPIDFKWEYNILLKHPRSDTSIDYLVNPDGSKKTIKITLYDISRKNVREIIHIENKNESNSNYLIFEKETKIKKRCY